MLWFTLFHELCHIYYDLEDLKSSNYHLSGASDILLLNEDRANHFARTMLFSDEKMNYIKPNINNHFVVSRYAEEHSVHPSIIYGFYIYDQPKSKQQSLYAKYHKYLTTSENALKALKTNVIGSENPREEIRLIIEKISN
jgi:HTH-type transcriptional regulator/antitoxin HigA